MDSGAAHSAIGHLRARWKRSSVIPPDQPQIYHIVHIDKLSSIVADDHLWSDAEASRRGSSGTSIGVNTIKERRRGNCLSSHPDLHVGDCVPFYFCPRSVMLYMLHMGNHPDLNYTGGQEPLLHLEADLKETVRWAERMGRRWAITLSNAGSLAFQDRSDLEALKQVNWDAVHARKWGGAGVDPSVKEGKQAEFLVEHSFPWRLVSRIGAENDQCRRQAELVIRGSGHQPRIQVLPAWYY